MIKQAIIDGIYRYSLVRLPEESDGWGPYSGTSVCFIMLNPSTADAEEDDPTVRRCVDFSRRWGCGGIEIVNLFALRATNPKELKRVPNPVGPKNDEYLARAIASHAWVVAAWGEGGWLLDRDSEVCRLAKQLGRKLFALKLTKSGAPQHPLRLSAKSKPFLWGADLSEEEQPNVGGT